MRALILLGLATALPAQDLLLINERGRNLPAQIGESSPFAVIEARTEEGKFAQVCNAFHLDLGEGSYLATAAHCIAGSQSVLVYYFDSRTGKQSHFPLAKEEIPSSKGDEKLFDFALLKIPASDRKRWDSIALDGGRENTQRYKVWSFELRKGGDTAFVADILNDRDRALFTPRICDGINKISPRIVVEWNYDGEIRHRKSLAVSYSDKGLEVEEPIGLYLESCVLSHGMSGALVTDDENHPIGLLHTGITSETIKKVWNQGLHLNFVKDALRTLGESTQLDKGKYLFKIDSSHSHQRSFSIDSKEQLYSVAILLSEALKR